jgi:hypothetical protein
MPGLGTIRRAVKTATKKRPGRRSKKGRKVIPEHIKNKAKAAGYSSVKKWKEAGSPEPKKKSKGKGKKDPSTLTAKEKAAIKKKNERNRRAAKLRQERFETRNPGIMASQAADAKAQKMSEQPTAQAVRAAVPSGGKRLPVFAPGLYPPPRSSIAGQSVEAGPLRSKVIPPGTTRKDRVSPARRRQLVRSGMAGVDPKTGLLTQKGTFAPPRRNTGEEMGILSPIDEEDILSNQGMSIIEPRKKGGKVKKKSSKKSSKGVGVGAALRGHGAVRKNRRT